MKGEKIVLEKGVLILDTEQGTIYKLGHQGGDGGGGGEGRGEERKSYKLCY